MTLRPVQDIRRAIEENRLLPEFSAEEVARAFPNRSLVNWRVFLLQHRVGNASRHTPYFRQQPNGRFRLVKRK